MRQYSLLRTGVVLVLFSSGWAKDHYTIPYKGTNAATRERNLSRRVGESSIE